MRDRVGYSVPMLTVVRLFLSLLRNSLRSHAALRAEILALRHQLLVLQRSTQGRRVRLQTADRVFWVWLSRLWQGWRSRAWIFKPETVISWSRKGFRLYWTWKSRRRIGRPSEPQEIRDLIREMSLANPHWGAPRIHEDDVSVFCCNGSADERDAAFRALDVSNTWIIEPSALATIFLLELEDYLSGLPVTLAISQGTLRELNEMLREDTLFQGSGGILTKSGAGIAFVEITPADREKRRQLLRTRIEKIKAACKSPPKKSV